LDDLTTAAITHRASRKKRKKDPISRFEMGGARHDPPSKDDGERNEGNVVMDNSIREKGRTSQECQ
jgi:hypothetical protein